MTIETWLKDAVQRLKAAGIETARLDTIVLLEDCLGVDRAQLLAHPEITLSDEHISKLDEHIMRRGTHEPLAYIRGKTEFYGRLFTVNQHVLEPRPESETIIEILSSLTLDDSVLLVDVGTGSGALAITAKLEYPNAQVIGIDIDPACLKVARQNTLMHEVMINLVEGDLIEPLQALDNSLIDAKTIVLLCNLPYVPDDFHINLAAGHEPRLAIFGGTDGLDLYRKLFEQLASLAQPPIYILAESLPPQHQKLVEIAEQHGYTLSHTDDFIQVFEPA